MIRHLIIHHLFITVVLFPITKYCPRAHVVTHVPKMTKVKLYMRWGRLVVHFVEMYLTRENASNPIEYAMRGSKCRLPPNGCD